MAGKMPVISITGPRQSGKTTLTKLCFPGYAYVNLENPQVLEEIMEDPTGFLLKHKKGIIIDEAQRFPDLFSYIQVVSDELNKPGKFILTGSQNFLLFEKITQSLAGRVYVTHLLPFSMSELKTSKYLPAGLNQLIFKGSYPRLYDKNIQPSDFYPSYLNTYIERDARQVLNIGNLLLFQKFIKIAAGRIAQTINYSQIANEVGTDEKTIKAWFSVLTTGFITFFLPPHHANFNKRLVKSPKLYFYDTGLACHLLGIKSAKELDGHWAKGALVESLIVSDLLKNRFNKGLQSDMYFWRESTGKEIDCIIESGNELKIIEIKSSSTINSSFFKSLNYYKELSKNKTIKSYLVYGGTKSNKRQGHEIISWDNTSEIC